MLTGVLATLNSTATAATCKRDTPGISPGQDVNSVISLFSDLPDQPIVLDLGSEQSELSGEI